MNHILLYCPATIATPSCGFDVLDHLESTGDRMLFGIRCKGIRITKIVGADLPLETEKNVAGDHALALLDAVETEFDLKSEI
jgi:homoserine kinase